MKNKRNLPAIPPKDQLLPKSAIELIKEALDSSLVEEAVAKTRPHPNPRK